MLTYADACRRLVCSELAAAEEERREMNAHIDKVWKTYSTYKVLI
jgi:hypothetical protein